MKPLLSFQESQALDAYFVNTCFMSFIELIESTASHIFRSMLFTIPELTRKDANILVIAGSGNNGADAVTVAKYLLFSGFINTTILLHEYKNTNIATKVKQLQAICNNIYTYKNFPARSSWDLIIDGYLGTGTNRPLQDLDTILKETLFTTQIPIAAIDLPSGVYEAENNCCVTSPLLVPARYTFTVAPEKAAAYFPGFRKACGNIFPVTHIFPEVLPSALPFSHSAIQKIDFEDFPFFKTTIAPYNHKYERGSVAVYGGCKNYSGAVLLASKAAESAGAGLVSLRVSDDLYSSLCGTVTGIIIEPEKSEKPRKVHAIVCGPGWEYNDDNRRKFYTLYNNDLPLVADATSLQFLDAQFLTQVSSKKTLVCTPHMAEMAQLLVSLSLCNSIDESMHAVLYNTKNILLQAAKFLHAIIVCKSATTWIASPSGTFYVYDGCTAALAVGGSGDILAGCIASFLSRNSDEPMTAVASAVLLHGQAGKNLAASSGFFDSSKLIDEIARITYKELVYG